MLKYNHSSFIAPLLAKKVRFNFDKTYRKTYAIIGIATVTVADFVTLLVSDFKAINYSELILS